MADNVQPRGRGRGGRGRGGNQTASRTPQGVFINPEGDIPGLVAKWSKKLGRDLASLEVKYTAAGREVRLTGLAGTPFAGLQSATIAEYRVIKAQQSAPSGAEKLTALRRKFENRLARDVPADFPIEGNEAAIAAFILALPFAERRLMNMSQKEFNAAAPNGPRAPAGA